jgi:hypothetical protein
MPLATRKSATITNIDATPRVRNDARHDSSVIRCKSEVGTLVTNDAGGNVTAEHSFIRLFQVSAFDSIKSIMFWNDAMTSDSASVRISFGLYTPNDGAAVDINLYANSLIFGTVRIIDPAGGSSTPVELVLSTGLRLPQHFNNAVWEDLALAAAPDVDTVYDFVATLTGNAADEILVGGDFAVRMLYTQL